MEQHLQPASTQTELETKGNQWGADEQHDSCVRVYGTSPGRLGVQIRSKGTITPQGLVARRAFSMATVDTEGAADLVAALQAWIDEEAEVARLAEAGR